MRTIVCFILCLSLCAMGCNNDQTSTTNTTESQASQAPATTSPYPGIPDDLRQRLLATTTSVDMIFYELPISISQNERPSIVNLLNHITMEPARISESCDAIGRISYQANGELFAEADMYLSDDCQYFIFMENNKPKYANQMSRAGYEFLNKVISNVQTVPNAAGQ